MNSLKREIGVWGAIMMGLGSIVGTGVFVSIGIAAGEVGPSVILAIVIGAIVATFNGLSSAQLAANHPVSGGTYEYGYRWLNPSLGFTAGWMFLCAKSASAATGALGFAGYTLNLIGQSESAWTVPLATAIVVVTSFLLLNGIRLSNWVNIVIVSITLASLTCFVLAGLPTALENGKHNLSPFFHAGPSGQPMGGFLEACALMFVAYTGYGRIATLGEEVSHPRKTIPQAIILTLILSSVLYVCVGFVAIAAVGSSALSTATTQQAAPLEVAARQFAIPAVSKIVAVGAVTAMLGVLLNLILGLSRVLLAMGRRGDLPVALSKVSANSTPSIAVIVIGVLIALLTFIGNVKTTWSFSAFTVLVYYALTNLAALQLSKDQRLFPVWIPWAGLLSCLSLAFWVERQIWIVGLAILLAGLLIRNLCRRHTVTSK